MISILLFCASVACGGVSTQTPPTASLPPPEPTATQGAPGAAAAVPKRAQGADVLEVSVTGAPGAYNFSVTVQSPDSGCARYSDWWEVVSPEGQLLYRRVLLHSHVEEQPFIGSGGPVNIQPGQKVIVRAHMNGAGYGGGAQSGSVAGGFTGVEHPKGLGADLEKLGPPPPSCAF
mgnify:FL=1